MIQDIFVQSLRNFHEDCNSRALRPEVTQNIVQIIDLSNNDIPLELAGLFYDLTHNFPQSYWNRDVADEVYSQLSLFKSMDEVKFISIFIKSLDHLFAGLNAYRDVLNLYSELNDVDYESGLKTRVFRNPIYTQICENCLMNLYRFIRDIIDAYSTKSYSSQNTLGVVSQVLEANGFPLASIINVNLRNAINHGDAYPNDNKLFFKYRDGISYKSEELSIWEYDDLINKSIDLVGGIIIGIFRLLGNSPNLFQAILSSTIDKKSKQEWIKLFFRSDNMSIVFFSEAILGTPQLNVNVETSIIAKESLLNALIQILKIIYISFPEYDRYMVMYQHNRSLPGSLRLSRSDIDKVININDDTNIIKAAISGLLIWDIQTDKVDERAYKFHMFPKMQGNNWSVINIKDFSTEEYKRIKAQLLIDRSCLLDKVMPIIEEVIQQLRKVYTPQNPTHKVLFGDREADTVHLNVHYRSEKRNLFSLLPDNQDYICLAQYYRDNTVPKLHATGSTSIWSQMKKWNYKDIVIWGNPSHFP